MERTTDIAFFDCPICGKSPYVATIDVNYGKAYCKGDFFHRHPIIEIKTGYCNPSKLYKTLSKGWNDSHWETLNTLPIRFHIEQVDE